MSEEPLSGHRILVVEDLFLLADDLSRALRAAGATVVGPLSTDGQAERAIGEERIDLALLDIDLRGKLVFPVVERLEERGIPYLFFSGFEQSSLPVQYRDAPFLAKPASGARVVSALARLLGEESTARR